MADRLFSSDRIGVERPPDQKGETIAQSHEMQRTKEDLDTELLLNLYRNGGIACVSEAISSGDWSPKAVTAVTRMIIDGIFPARDCYRNQHEKPPQREPSVYKPSFKVYHSPPKAPQVADPSAWSGFVEQGKKLG